MFGGNPNSYIQQDNSKLQKEVHNAFDMGNFKFNNGSTIEEKQEGLKLLIGGLRKLQMWIDREGDPQRKQMLQDIYKDKHQSIGEKMTLLESNKQQINKPVVMQEGGNSGGKGPENENDKFKNALSEAIVKDKPNVKWEDIAGLEQAKASLKEAVIMPIKFPQIFDGVRKPWKGILLYGPPGTGKTFLAKACATECDATFFSISAADLVSKYVGETEKMIKGLFNLAREQKPSIIFIDECDSMFGARGEGQQESSRRAITEFLTQMQGVGRDDKGVLVLGASNLPWALDSAVRRRFEKRIYIPLPDLTARTYMIERSLSKTTHSLNKQQIEQFAQKMDGYSGSDINVIIKDSSMQSLRLLQKTDKFKIVVGQNGKQQYMPVPQNTPMGPDMKQMNYMDLQQDELMIPPLSGSDFADSVAKNKPSVGKDQLDEYVKFTETFGQDG